MKGKRTLAVFLMLMLVMSVTLAGCKKETLEQTKTKSNESSNKEGSTDQNVPTQTDQDVTGFTDVTLPLTDEKVTLTVWAKSDITLINSCNGDLNNVPFFQELEKRTNVHIDWMVPTSGSQQEQFSLMVSSGELPDIIYQDGTVSYTDGNDAALDDGYFLDLTDLIKQYAPNYLASIAAGDEVVQKSVRTDAGKYIGFYDIMKEKQPPFMGFMVRQDWLDELGLQLPVTYEDWENVLTQFKEKKGATAPLAIVKREIWDLGTGMDVYSGFYQKDGKVGFSLYDNPEGCKAYITLLNKWYSKGLIDPDFASSTSWLGGDPVLVTNNSTGIFSSMYTLPSSAYKPSMSENTDFSAINAPKLSADQTLKFRTIMDQHIGGSYYVVSTSCKNPEVAVKWLDYLYSDKGSLFANYGVEGDTYTLDASGTPQFTDKITKNSDGLSFDQSLRMFTLGPGWPAARMDYKRELLFVNEKDAKMMTDWAATTEDYVYPAFASMTSEENSEFSSLYTDIQTYVEENVLRFTTGAKDLSEFDSFIEALKGMNIERCIELKQAALERYNAR